MGEVIEEKGNWLRSITCPDYPANDKQIEFFRNGWNIRDKWYKMEQVSKDIFVYHCHNSLFPFKITINIEKEADASHEAYKNYLE